MNDAQDAQRAIEERFKQEFWNGVAAGAGTFGLIWFLVANWDHTLLVVSSAWFYRIAGIVVVLAIFNAWRRHRKLAATVRYSRSLRLDRQ